MQRIFKYQNLLLATGLALAFSTHAQFGGDSRGGTSSSRTGVGLISGGWGSDGLGGRNEADKGSLRSGEVPFSSSTGIPGVDQMPAPGTDPPGLPGGGNPCASAICGSGTGTGGNTGGGASGGDPPQDEIIRGNGSNRVKSLPSGVAVTAPARQ